jgi:F-type H+-transporting ATPase subunit epsilon
MAATLQFDLVSPERRLASFAATEVRIPGAEGDFTAMPGHAPFLTTLRPGFVSVRAADGAESRFAVTGGFAEVGATGVSVLAERSLPASELTQAIIDQLVAEARQAADSAPAEGADAAAKLVADLRAMALEAGLSAPPG